MLGFLASPAPKAAATLDRKSWRPVCGQWGPSAAQPLLLPGMPLPFDAPHLNCESGRGLIGSKDTSDQNGVPDCSPCCPPHTNLSCPASHAIFSLWEMQPQGRSEWGSMAWCDTVLAKFWTGSRCSKKQSSWGKANEKVLKSCGQGAGKSTMDLQDPRGQGVAAIMPNGKGQGRQEVPGPQGGHFCYERDLLVGLQSSMGEQSHGQAVA